MLHYTLVVSGQLSVEWDSCQTLQEIVVSSSPPQHYSVVDASEGQVFIAVYHTFNNTNLYLSEEQGLNYSLSLEYIISPPESDWINGYPAFDVHVVSVCV